MTASFQDMGARSDDAADLRSAAADLIAETKLLRAQWTEILEVLDDLDGLVDRKEPVTGPIGIDDPVRLTAVDLKLAGHTREGVERFLREQFAIEPAPDMLDSIFRPTEDR